MIRREAAIRIENLAIGYEGRRHRKLVAEAICAEVCRGELTCLLGANGVGKSTLLRTLSAFQPPLGGSIRLLGRELAEYGVVELARTIGMVLTEKCDLRNMRVEELVGMGRSPYTGFWGRLSAEDLRIVDDAVEQVGIGALRGRMVHTLSDGERQKVMIAKALAQQTPVIFLDEPTAFLDFPSKVETMQLLHRLTRRSGMTIFLSTHDIELALQIADKVWLMERGKGISIGTPEDLAVEGALQGFITRRGIVFDAVTGLFRIENELRHPVAVSGTGIRRDMLCKALHRRGFATVEGEAACRIEAGERFTLTTPHGQLAAERIEPILLVLEEEFQSR